MRFTEEQLVTAGIVITVILMVVWFFAVFGQPPAVVAPAADPIPATEPIELCGQVVRSSCEMVIKEKTGSCKRQQVEPAVTARLAEPMADEACKQAHLELADGCPQSCLFDYGTLVMVPGSAQVDFFDRPDENGQCFVRARRTVTMQGTCAERMLPPAQPDPSPTP